MLPAIIFIHKAAGWVLRRFGPYSAPASGFDAAICTILSFLANVCEHPEIIDSARFAGKKTPATLGSTFAAHSGCMEQRNVF
jgi:hypothetical protein